MTAVTNAPTHPSPVALRIADVNAALYPTRVTHLHRSPVSHYAEHRSYSWFVDVDDLPRLPVWLRPFARFEAADHLHGAPHETLRQRVESVLAANGMRLPGGRITAMLMPRVLGRAFNPLSLFWCHDAAGVLRCVVAEVQTIGGERHAHLLPAADDAPVAVTSISSNAPFTGDDGYFLVRVPEPGETLDLTVSQHRANQAAMVATWRGNRRPATVGQIIRLQFSAPLAPLVAEISMRFQAVMLRMLGAPEPARRRLGPTHSPAAWPANNRSLAPS